MHFYALLRPFVHSLEWIDLFLTPRHASSIRTHSFNIRRANKCSYLVETHCTLSFHFSRIFYECLTTSCARVAFNFIHSLFRNDPVSNGFYHPKTTPIKFERTRSSQKTLSCKCWKLHLKFGKIKKSIFNFKFKFCIVGSCRVYLGEKIHFLIGRCAPAHKL